MYLISFATVYWIDIFIRERYNELIVDSLNYCVKEKGLVIFGWCLMTSHIHLLAKSEKEGLQDIIRNFKKYTSRQMIKLIKENPQESRREWLLELFLKAGNINSNNKKYQLWQQHNKPIEIRGTEMMLQKINYIHKNPVVSRVVN